MLNVCPHCRNTDLEKNVREKGGEDSFAVAKCNDCSHEFEFPYLPLFTLEGPPSAGKSTTAGHLLDGIPLSVWEDDLLIDLVGGNLPWGGICELGLRICMTVHATGQAALKVGGIHPYDLSESPERRYFSRIERCALIAEDEAYEARLQERPFFQSNPEKIGEHATYNRWYRQEGPDQGIHTIDTTELDSSEVADRVKSWIMDNSG